jgi:type VI secretion system ImpA family protein
MRELSELLRPIPGPNPSGKDCRYTGVFDRIKEARREDLDLPQGDWKSERKTADWAAVVEFCSDALIHQTKDLQIASWITEALLHTNGYAGLVAGLQLLRSLIDNFWSTLYPRSEDDELELRAAPLEWLGSRLDFSVKSSPLVPEGTNWFEFEARRQVKDGSMAAIDDATRRYYRARVEELNSCQDALRELDTSCLAHFQGASPQFGRLQASLDTVKLTLRSLIGTMPESCPVEVLSFDPPTAERTDILQNAQRETRPRERIERAIREAENMLLAGSFDEALALLTGSDADAVDPRVRDLARHILNQKEDRQRLDRLRSEVSASAALLRAGRIDEAAVQLHALANEFPEREDVSDLLNHAKKELEARQRRDAVSQASAEARTLLDRRCFQEAAWILKEASESYPGEPQLQALLTQAEGLSARMSRQMARSLDHVHFTITAVSSLEPGKSFELYFWVHLNRQRKAVIDRAMLALGVGKPEAMVVKSEGPVLLARGTVVSARVSIDDLTLDPCEKSVLWSGETGCASFVIPVPPAAAQGQYHGIISIRVNSCEVARMDFLLRVAGRPGRVPAKLKRHTTAFASYASEDRDAVVARLQGMQKVAPWLKVFVDIVDLRSGEQWEHRLRQAIGESDVFYLFWCTHARASEWVDREWRYAYEQRGLEFIDPVPLEPPHNAPPPDELRAKHFNDVWTELNSKGHNG